MVARKLMVAAAVSSLTVLFLPTAAGAAKPVQCGQLVTSSLKLTADLGPCPGDGLVIAKKGVSLDLNGHTIRGMGDHTLDQVGIRIASVDGAEVSNGTVRNFSVGVAVEASIGSSVKRITATDNVNTGAANHGDGILIDGSTKTRVIGNDVGGNGPYGGISLVDEATNNLVKGNNIHDNVAIRTEPAGQPPWAPPPVQQNIGVRLESGSNDNTIDGNRIANNGSHGISVPGPDHVGTVVTNNLIEGNGGFGVVSPGDGFLLDGNTIKNNAFDGLLLFGNFTKGPGTVTNNTIEGNAGNGINVINPGFQYQGTYDEPVVYQIHNNTVRNNAHNGIFVGCDFLADAFPNHVCLDTTPPHTGQQITGNTTSGNGGASAGISYWDLYDENTQPCDHNTWLDNTADTFNPACTDATSP